MSTTTIDQRQLQTLGQLLSAGGHSDVNTMLEASLGRLMAFWPALGGALLYQTPHGEVIRLQQGEISADDSRMIAEAREAFSRREEGSEPSIGSYALDDERQLLELPLQSDKQSVGLLHLVVRENEAARPAIAADEEVVMMLVRAIGGEADKLALLQHAHHDLRELHLLYEVGQALASNLDLQSLLEDIKQRVPEVMNAERANWCWKRSTLIPTNRASFIFRLIGVLPVGWLQTALARSLTTWNRTRAGLTVWRAT